MTAESTKRGCAALLGEVPDGGRRHVMAGDREVTLLRSGDRISAVVTHCPHLGGRLGDGEVQGQEIVCPMHRWRFDLRTGRTKRDRRLASVLVPIEVESGEIRWKSP